MRRATLIALTLAAVVAGCGGGDESTAPTGEGGVSKLKVQETAGVPSAFVGFGIQKRFFKAQKLDIALEPTQGGAATIPALVSGDIQIGGSNVVSLLLASSKNLPIRVIAGGTTAQGDGEKDFGALVVDKRSRVRRAGQLRGQVVGVNTLDNIAEVVVKASLESQGLDPENSVRLTEVPFPEMQAALEKGAIGAAFSIEPFVTQTLQAGGKAIDYSYVETEPGMQVGAYAVTNQFAEKNPDVVKRFKAAVVKTADYVGANEDEFRTYLSESAKIPPKLAKTIVLPNWTGEVNAQSVENTAKLMQRYGVVDAPIDTGKLLQGGGA